MREHTGTRARIQEIALRLFTEQGYEATSLREIAEALGVTKAALYYHFKTKEDIVASLTEARTAAIDELIEWGREQEHTPEFRAELIRRYAGLLEEGRHGEIMQFMQRNQTVLRDHPALENLRDKMLLLVGMLTEQAETPTERLRRAMSLFAMHVPWFLLRDDPMTERERHEAGLQVALDLVGAGKDDRHRNG